MGSHYNGLSERVVRQGRSSSSRRCGWYDERGEQVNERKAMDEEQESESMSEMEDGKMEGGREKEGRKKKRKRKREKAREGGSVNKGGGGYQAGRKKGKIDQLAGAACLGAGFRACLG